MKFYQYQETPCAFSHLIQYTKLTQTRIIDHLTNPVNKRVKLIDIVAYCLMPNHFHFLLKQNIENGIPIFLNNVLNGFTRYYNIRNDRKGPLWIGRSKSVHIAHDDQLWHVSRYIHLNPVKARLANNPSDWVYSSYIEYLGMINHINQVCSKSIILDSDLTNYKDFVEDKSTDAVDLSELYSEI